MEIGNLKFDRFVALAPMEDISDIAFRILCKELGADMVYTEFVNSDGLNRKVKSLISKIELLEEERPIGIQIYGQDIDSMKDATLITLEKKPDLIDINAGCWVKKVSKRGAGAGLMKDPVHLQELVKAVVDNSTVPVTVKTRLGWDHDNINILEIAKRIEDVGAKALTLHCRTRSQGHSGESHWSWVNKVKEVISIPVILNGGIMTAEDAKRAYEETNCDGIMIARGAIGKPWIFKEISEILEFGKIKTVFDLPYKIDICLRHLKRSLDIKQERIAIPAFRKFYAGYLSGFPGIGNVRRELMFFTTFNQIEDRLLEFRNSISTQDHSTMVS